ncbi:MAG: hypothetical protein ABMB14_03730 [Myxococcota bacterium]
MVALALWGCPWIGAAEHDRNQAALEADGDADADSDADTDTADTHTGSDTDPPACVDDGYEPNNAILNATSADPPSASFDGVLCPDDVSIVTGFPLDLFEIELGPLDVLTVELAGRDGWRCADLTLGVQITDELGAPFPGATAAGGCPSVHAGWGAGPTYAWVSDAIGAEEQRYTLDLSVSRCEDLDGDSFLASACGGPDCSDTEPDRYPYATDHQDGVDQDCDGGDDLDPQPCVVSTGAEFVEGNVACGDLAADPVWDRWVVDGGGQLSVVVQNGAVGAADPVALIVDPDGRSHYGLQPNRSQMDDERSCDVPSWSGLDCPAACVLPTSAGPSTVWVAQQPGAGCVTGAYYRLLVYVDGAPTLPTLTGDDIPLAFP